MVSNTKESPTIMDYIKQELRILTYRSRIYLNEFLCTFNAPSLEGFGPQARDEIRNEWRRQYESSNSNLCHVVAKAYADIGMQDHSKRFTQLAERYSTNASR